MAWSGVTPTGGNSWTDLSLTSTADYSQLEPSGFGNEPWGSPSDIEDGLRIHMRGFGSPRTVWTST